MWRGIRRRGRGFGSVCIGKTGRRRGAAGAWRGAGVLPGKLGIERGEVGDYRGLADFHYVPGDPATWAGIWKCVYWEDGETARGGAAGGGAVGLRGRVVGVGVLSYP